MMSEQSQETRPSFYSYDFSQFHRDHFGNNSEFGDYEFAYQYGYQLAYDQRYQGRVWADIESDAMEDWQNHYPDFTWDHYGAAVREGWRNVAGTLR